MKILIVHPGTQHSAKLAAALKSGNNEVLLITTVYKKKGSITGFLASFLPQSEKKRLESRVNASLIDSDIMPMCELRGLLLLAIARIDKKKKFYTVYKRVVAKAVGKKAARFACAHDYDAVISFDSYSMYLFEELGKHHYKGITITDYSAAYAPYAKNVYLKQIESHPQLSETLMAERPVLWNNKYFEDMQKEPSFPQYIICASSYTKKTLTTYGICGEKISIIPYGYNPALPPIEKKQNSSIFNFLFVGNVSVMKGIHLLIYAFREINDSTIRLTLVGNPQKTIQEMSINDKNITLKGYVPHNELYKEYLDANVFVFPSLSDGFGFAPLEAMCYGVPCIVSKSSGIADIISDGIDGIIIEDNSVEAIRRAMVMCMNDKEKILTMGCRAKEKALKHTLENYIAELNTYIDGLGSK